jgi:hypothetical protein
MEPAVPMDVHGVRRPDSKPPLIMGSANTTGHIKNKASKALRVAGIILITYLHWISGLQPRKI